MADDPLDEYIRLAWKGWAEGAFQAQKQLIGWLFTLHGAGVAATLGYANSKGISSPIVVALVSFVLGKCVC